MRRKDNGSRKRYHMCLNQTRNVERYVKKREKINHGGILFSLILRYNLFYNLKKNKLKFVLNSKVQNIRTTVIKLFLGKQHEKTTFENQIKK